MNEELELVAIIAAFTLNRHFICNRRAELGLLRGADHVVRLFYEAANRAVALGFLRKRRSMSPPAVSKAVSRGFSILGETIVNLIFLLPHFGG